MATSIITGTANIEGSPWESLRLFFTGRTRRVFLWKVFISLHRSCCYSSWRSNVISNSNIFFYKRDKISSRWHPWWELGGSAASKACLQAPPPFPLLRLPLGSPRYPIFFSATPIFFSFSPQCGAWSQAITIFTGTFRVKGGGRFSSRRLTWSQLY